MVQQSAMIQQPVYIAQQPGFQPSRTTNLCECDGSWCGFCCLSTWFFGIGSLVIDFKINGTGTFVGWFLFLLVSVIGSHFASYKFP